MQLLELLEVCLEADKYQFLSHLGPVCGMLARVSQDENPEMKQKVASFAGALCRALPEKVGNYMKTTVDGLVANLGHQHKNVRKISLRGLKDVLVARGAEFFLADCMNQLKFVMNDRSADVRRTFFEVVQYWMTKMDIHAIKAFEGDFTLLLLNGVADEQAEISGMCSDFLEAHGNRMRDALRQLGELDSKGLDGDVEMN